MGLAERLADPQIQKRSGDWCALVDVMAKMPEKDRLLLEKLFEMPSVKRPVTIKNIHVSINQEFSEQGLDVPFWQVKEHAGRNCRCYR